MVHLDYRDARPIYTQIIDGFKEQISTGVLQSGEKLPSVRELASQLAINPNTIQRAYRELESLGYVYSAAGRGSFVAAADETGKLHRQELLERFDALVVELESAGCSREQLVARLEEGGAR